MRKLLKIQTKKRILLIIVNAFLLILVAGLCVISGRLKSTLASQQFADRWSADGNPYNQVSVFLVDGLASEELKSTVEAFEQKLTEMGITDDASEEGGNLIWTYGYSAWSTLSVTWEDSSVEAAATGVGENFFMFHPLKLRSGSYIFGSDLMQDRVVIDESLAWQLFGATNVAGLELEIGGRPYIIAGVVMAEDDFASTAAYGDKPRIYLPYGALLLNDRNAKVTCLELLMPNPVENFTFETAHSILKAMGVEEINREIIDNTSRYSVAALFDVISDFGLRSMCHAGLTYPYWENAARIVEDFLALFLVIMIVLLIFPTISLVLLIVGLWHGRKWRMRNLKSLVEYRIETCREQKKLSGKQ